MHHMLNNKLSYDDIDIKTESESPLCDKMFEKIEELMGGNFKEELTGLIERDAEKRPQRFI